MAATPPKSAKPKPRRLSDKQLAARIARDSAELAKRAGANTGAKKTQSKTPSKK